MINYTLQLYLMFPCSNAEQQTVHARFATGQMDLTHLACSAQMEKCQFSLGFGCCSNASESQQAQEAPQHDM